MKGRLVTWFGEIGLGDKRVFGKKCANLGEMTRLNMPLPLGFAISVKAQEMFLRESGALDEIEALLIRAGDLRDVEPEAQLSSQIRDIIGNKEIPADVRSVIELYYEEICAKRGREVDVSVMSAGVKSHPGMYETYLNVRGRGEVLDKVRKVWSSTFNSRTIAVRVRLDLPVIDSPYIGVGVVEMINARCAGVCFTAHPATRDPMKALIQANWGLGESVVSGVVSVDSYVVDKDRLTVVNRSLGEKKLQIVPQGNGVLMEEVSPEKRDAFVLTDEEAAEIVKLGKALEAHFNQPQDFQWVINADQSFPQCIYLLQTHGMVGAKVEKAKTREERALEECKDKVR